MHAGTVGDARDAVVDERRLLGEVLVEVAVQRDREHLVAPTDGQRRDTELERSLHDDQLTGVPARVDPGGGVVSGRAVRRRVEIAAAQQQQPVDATEELDGLVR